MSTGDLVVDSGERHADHPGSFDSLDALLRIGREPKSDLDLTTVLQDVLSVIIRSVSAGSGSILILDEGGWPSHWFVLQDGEASFVTLALARVVIERGIIGWTIQNHQGDLVQDVADDPRWLDLPGFAHGVKRGAALCLPLLVYDRIVGVLTLLHPTPGFFKPRHLSLLQNVAERVALSIENARLYETVRRRVEEMVALYEVGLNISADQPLHRLLDTIVAQAMDLLHSPGGGLFLWREAEGYLELVAAYDPEIDIRGTQVISGKGLVGRVFETSEPMTLDEYDAGDAADDISLGLPAATAMAVPLVWQGLPIGVLMTTDHTPDRHFDHNERHLLTLLANQASAVIVSAQLREQTTRSLQELAFLNETIQDITATLDLNEIFEILTRRVKDLLGSEACSIALVDHETNDLVFYVASGGGAETVTGERVPWGQGIVGAAAQTGEPVNVPDVQQDARFYRDMDQKQAEFVTHSILAVPMIRRGQVVGVVEGLNKPDGFDGEDERLLSALASLAASVVENANLFNSVRVAEARYQALFEDAADAAWVTDVQGRVIQANRKAVGLTGRADEEMLGTVLWTLTASEEHDLWQKVLARAVAGEEPTLESWIMGVDETKCPLEMRLKQIQVDGGYGVRYVDGTDLPIGRHGQPNVTHVQWIGRDISARRELEQLRDSLSHMVVHDLRSPVGTVSSSLGLLKGLLGDGESNQAAQLVDIASRATQRLSNLVDSLLDINRLEAGQELTDRLPVSIRPLVRSAVDQVALYARRKQIKLTVDLPERLPFVLADGGMVERVLVNLLDNALKFTPMGGEVDISVETDDDVLCVRVCDNGPGVPPQYQRRIFEKFAQVQGEVARGGIGLGLAFCRLAVEAHGGRIWVESLSGEGSAFVFTLPLD